VGCPKAGPNPRARSFGGRSLHHPLARSLPSLISRTSFACSHSNPASGACSCILSPWGSFFLHRIWCPQAPANLISRRVVPFGWIGIECEAEDSLLWGFGFVRAGRRVVWELGGSSRTTAGRSCGLTSPTRSRTWETSGRSRSLALLTPRALCSRRCKPFTGSSVSGISMCAAVVAVSLIRLSISAAWLATFSLARA
jgi:hypothetical protein